MANFFDVLSEELPAVDTNVDDSTDNQTDDTTVDDAADADGASDDTDTDDADAGDGDGDAAADADAAKTVTTADGVLPKELSSLAKQHPEAAKLLKDLYFTNQRLMKIGKPGEIRKMKEAVDAFGSLDNVVKIKDQLDSIGGEQGLQELIQQRDSYHTVEENYESNPAEFVDTLFEASQDAFDNFVPAALIKLGNSSPEAYDRLMSQVITNTFIQNGTFNSLALAKQALSANNTQLAGQELDKLGANFAGIKQTADAAPKAKVIDPAKQKFDQERQSFEQKQNEAFIKEVTATNTQWTQTSVKSELASYLKGTKFSDSQFTRMYEAIRSEIIATLNKNPKLTQQWETLKSRKDRDGMIRFTKQHVGKILPDITRNIAREFNLNPTAAKKASTAAKTTKADDGWTSVKTLPPYYEVDKAATKAYAKTQGKTYEEMVDKGMVITNDGRKLKLTKLTA